MLYITEHDYSYIWLVFHNNNIYYEVQNIIQYHNYYNYYDHLTHMNCVCRLHGATTGGAMKVGNIQVFATILRRSLLCSLLLDGDSMGKVNYTHGSMTVL